MQKQSIPPYKPSPEIAEAIRRQQQLQEQNPQGQQRRRTAVLPKRSWIQRNPRVFQITFITGALLVLFSKPLYDLFIATPPVSTVRVPPHKR